jgi:uncharacterized protein (TIGR02687 family)
MIEEKVSSYFERFPDLKILFFFDEDQEYLEQVKSLNIPNLHIEFYSGNAFTTKCKLLNELIDTKVLLYLPLAHPNTQDEYHQFQLLGLLLANKELKLDNVGEFMETYGLQRHQKGLVTKYMKELKYLGVQQVCEPILTPYGFEETAIQKGLISSYLKFKNIENWSLIISKILTLLVAKDESELNKMLAKIADLKMQDVIIQQFSENTSYVMKSLCRDELLQVARCVFYNKITQTISAVSNLDPYLSFKIKDQTQIVRLNQLLNDTEKNSQISSSFNEVMKLVSNDIKGEKLIDIYGLDANFTEFSPSMIWAIVNNLQSQISTAPEEVIKKLDAISIQQSLEEGIRNFLKYLTYTTKLHQMVNNISSYILNKPEDYLKSYSEELYFIDSLYRKAIKAYKLIDYSELPTTINLDNLHLALNNRYEKHTDKLNREWLKCLNEIDFDYAKIPVAKQYEFYKNEIETLNQKVVVFISDALRYEVAHELLSELHGDPNNTAKMRYMMASIPSKTNIGMAQLLPPDNLIYNNGDIINSTISTGGLPNRNAILQKNKSDSLAVQYNDIIGNSQEKNREIFKNSVVYLYHDIIDSIGDKRASERRTFDAVNHAIDEIKRLVKKLHGSWNVAKVIITADHGFLYNDREIEDKDLEEISEQNPLATHNRYFVTTNKSLQPLGYSIPLSKTTIFSDEVFVTIPSSVNRYRKQGVGHQFVHGGGSLQEVVIPVIESSRKREEIVTKVRPSIINQGELKVVSNILRFTLLQETKVSRMEKELNISIGLYNNNNLVSQEIITVLNYTSDSPSERIKRIELTLSSDTPKNAFLKLKVFDLEDTLNPIIEERVQNNTLIQSDF